MPPVVAIFAFPQMTPTAVFDIIAVAFVIYRLLMIVRGTRAAHILAGILAIAIVYQAALRFGLETLRSMMSTLAPYTPIALIVLFQSEIRRALGRLGRRRLFGGQQHSESVDEIVLALGALSRDRIGALIIMERDTGLRTFIESGVRLDSQVSRDLLVTIFRPGTPLHDGAVIVQKDRISAAACFLPLTVRAELSTTLGTRHRAAIGITEETDCLALVVSEETGAISIASAGEIEFNVTTTRADERIHKHFGFRRGIGNPAPHTSPSLPVTPEQVDREAKTYHDVKR